MILEGLIKFPHGAIFQSKDIWRRSFKARSGCKFFGSFAHDNLLTDDIALSRCFQMLTKKN